MNIDKKIQTEIRCMASTYINLDFNDQEIDAFISKAPKVIMEDFKNSIIEIVVENIRGSIVFYFNEQFSNESGGNLHRWDFFFKNFIEKPTNREFFFDYFFGLKRNILQDISDFFEMYIKVYKSFLEKENILREKFNINGEMLAIDVGIGDKHNGKSVCELIFEEGELIFKPQIVNHEILIKKSISFLNHYLDESIVYPNSVYFYDQGNTWVEKVYENTLNDEDTDAINEFYKECGLFLSVFYMLNSSDMHYENLLIKQNHPFFIDLETLVTPLIRERNEYNLNLSVLTSGMLPTPTSESRNNSVSALFSIDDSVIKNESVQIPIFTDKKGFVFKKNIWTCGQ